MQKRVYKCDFLQNGRICCERPIMYLRQIPENAWNYGNNNYIYANRVNMQNNYIDYWSRNVAATNKEQCREELRRAFKNMLDAASKQTENTAPMLSIFLMPLDLSWRIILRRL